MSVSSYRSTSFSTISGVCVCVCVCVCVYQKQIPLPLTWICINFGILQFSLVTTFTSKSHNSSLTSLLLFPYLRSGQMYYMFGFIMLAFLVLIIVCAQIAVLLCYFHLCAEDYRWWWHSFFSTGSTAIYLSLFSLHYFVNKTSITGSLSYLLYFGYTFIIVFLFFIMTGERRV